MKEWSSHLKPNPVNKNVCKGFFKKYYNVMFAGWSATYDDEHHSTLVSTRHYRAPEVILG